MQENYRTCLIRMEEFEDFVHYNNNMMGHLFKASTQLIRYYQFDYSIFSYNTLICFINFGNSTYCINPTRYSATTSKQASYIRRAAKVWEQKGFDRILWI